MFLLASLIERTLPNMYMNYLEVLTCYTPAGFHPFYFLRGKKYPHFWFIIPLTFFIVFWNMFICLTVHYLHLHTCDLCINALILAIFFCNLLFSFNIRFLRFVDIFDCGYSLLIHITI